MKLYQSTSQKIYGALAVFFLILSLVGALGYAYTRISITQQHALAKSQHLLSPADSSNNDSTNNTKGLVYGISDGTLSFQTPNTYNSSNGGVLVLNAGEQPQIQINSNAASGQGNFTLYKVSKDDLVNYLLYKKSAQQDGNTYSYSTERVLTLDINSLSIDKTFQHDVHTGDDQEKYNQVSLPITGNGIWLLKGTVGEKDVETMLIRTNLGAITHLGDNQNIFWVQDTSSSNVADAKIELLNLENSKSSLGELTTNQEGLATQPVNAQLDIALVSKGDDITLIPVNLDNLNYRLNPAGGMYSSFGPRQVPSKSFFFTDRYLYQPGDTVYFKAIIRNDDDANYSVTSSPITVKLQGAEFEWEKSFTPDDIGSIDGAIQIPKDTKPGYFSLETLLGDRSLDFAGFQVAKYRKPDSSVSIRTDKLMYLPGETVTAKITGTAFLGQPIRNQNIRYKVYEQEATYTNGDYNEVKFIQSIEDFNSMGGEAKKPLFEGDVTLDNKGTAELKLPVKNETGYRQFWIIHIEYLDGASTATNDAVQALINPGEFVIGNDPSQQVLVANKEGSLVYGLKRNKADATISNIPIKAQLYRSIPNSSDYALEQDNLQATSDANGKLQFMFTPKESISYELRMEAKDKAGNTIKHKHNFYVAKEDINTPVQIFTITPDKKTYNVGDTAKVTVTTKPERKNVFISVGRSYSREYRVLNLVNGTATFDIQVQEKYQPNIHVMAGSFLGDQWKQLSETLPVNTDDKQISIKITPSQQIYGPAQTATFDIQTTDGNGKPVKADMAFWIFDKALLEIQGNYFEGIFDHFWDPRWFSIPTKYSYAGLSSNGAEGGGGCFVGETTVTMADGTKKRIDQVKANEQILTYSSEHQIQKTSAKVLGTHQVTVDGYLILNRSLKVTPEHKLLVNKQWKTAGEVIVGDLLLSEDGKEIDITSIEYIRAKTQVYNLYIEKYHTYFANDIYVHNDKGDSRSVFKDTAYWNPHVKTGDDGKATVTVTLPDNLTTWVTAAVAANSTTQVGDGKSEFVVTKDIVTRPILSGFLRVGDQIALTSLIQNFTKKAEKFAVEAKLDGAELQNIQQSLTVAAEEIGEVIWAAKILTPNPQAAFQVSTKGINNQKLIDIVTEKLPIYEYGSWISKYVKVQNSAEISVQYSGGTDAARNEFTLQLHATRYPELQQMLTQRLDTSQYGSAEDLSSVLIAASIINQYGKNLGININAQSITEKTTQASQGLTEQQSPNGSWLETINNTTQSSPARTRAAIEGLVTAQKAGLAVNTQTLEKALQYFVNLNAVSWMDQVEQQYVFSLFPDRQLSRKKLEFQPNFDPEYTARAVIANTRQKLTNSTIEESELLSRAKETPTQIAWVNANQKGWTSVSSPTAWSTLAMTELGLDQPKIEKALDYLYRNDSSGSDTLIPQMLSTLKYYQTSGQLAPNYQYTVFVNNAQVGTGAVTPAKQKLPDITLPANTIPDSATVRIEKNGNGNLYTRLEQKEFFTDRSVSAQQHNLSISRRYLAGKGDNQPLKPGDLVVVTFEVSGLGSGENNIEVNDYLPSGLVAIDETLFNGNFDNPEVGKDMVQQEITEQGMKLIFDHTFSDTVTASYKARVVSEGIFDTPPAVVKLANDPSIWAMTDSYQLKIDGKTILAAAPNAVSYPPSYPSPANIIKNATVAQIVAVVGTAALGVLAGFVTYMNRAKIITYFQKFKKPPMPPHDFPSELQNP